jgi:N-methylhydantoinase B
VRTYGMVCDSGGPGRFRGGCGMVREYEVLAEEAVLAIRIDGVENPPWGIAGGKQGGTGRITVNPGTAQERVLPPLSDGNRVHKGDIVRVETGGGGGYGPPFERPADAVLEDHLGGLVSVAAAREEYGVVISGDTIDADATARLRERRPPVRAFHRHDYVDTLA